MEHEQPSNPDPAAEPQPPTEAATTYADRLARKLASLSALAEGINARTAEGVRATPAEPDPTPAPPKRTASKPAAPRKRKAASGHGGARAGAGVKPIGPTPRTAAAYIALTAREKRELEAKAKKARLSVSSYMRKRLGFLVEG